MKPKFRIGDRVKTIEHGKMGYVIELGEDMYPTREVFAVGDTLDAKCGDATPFYFENELELVGCGIPAPALRWETKDEFTEAKVFGVYFRIRSLRNGERFSVCGEFYRIDFHTEEEAKEACQAYWQQLWDKEMLISRDLPETGEFPRTIVGY